MQMKHHLVTSAGNSDEINGNLDAVQSTIRWRAQVRSSKTIKIRHLSIILSIVRG